MIPVDGASDRWEIAPELRKRVLSLRHNLASDPPPMAATPCQVVFCRNVLIYFGHDEVVAFLNRLSTWLPAGAYLFLGYSESLWLVSERFHLIRLGDAFVYRNGPAEHSTAVQRPVRVEGPAPAPATSDVETPPRQPLQQAAARFDPRPLGLLAEGESAMGERDYARAVTAFRKASFLDPDQPLGYLSLGLALEAMGDMAAAQRAYAAARASVERCDVTAIETTLDGYQLHEFTRMLDLKTGAS